MKILTFKREIPLHADPRIFRFPLKRHPPLSLPLQGFAFVCQERWRGSAKYFTCCFGGEPSPPPPPPPPPLSVCGKAFHSFLFPILSLRKIHVGVGGPTLVPTHRISRKNSRFSRQCALLKLNRNCPNFRNGNP